MTRTEKICRYLNRGFKISENEVVRLFDFKSFQSCVGSIRKNNTTKVEVFNIGNLRYIRKTEMKPNELRYKKSKKAKLKECLVSGGIMSAAQITEKYGLSRPRGTLSRISIDSPEGYIDKKNIDGVYYYFWVFGEKKAPQPIQRSENFNRATRGAWV